MSTPEDRSKLNQNIPSVGVHFSGQELRYIDYHHRYPNQGKGDFILTLTEYKNPDQILRRNLQALEAQGGINIRFRKNQVFVGMDDPSDLLKRVTAAGMDNIKPILGLMPQGVEDIIHEAVILPNASGDPDKLNGAVIQFQNWRDSLNISKLGPIGRGIFIAPLPAGLDEDWLLGEGEAGMNNIHTKCRRTLSSERHIKYVQLLHNRLGELYLAVAAGPSPLERSALVRDVKKRQVTRGIGREIPGLLTSFQKTQEENRRVIAKHLFALLGISEPPEELTNVPYVWFDAEKGVFCSGGVDAGPQGRVVPFTVGPNEIILHNSVDFSLIGTGVGPVDSRRILLPDVRTEENEKMQIDFGASDGMKTAGMPKVHGTSLRTTAILFHDNWDYLSANRFHNSL